ncbi:MAG TPA: hypothetical protein VK176_05080 [Phycisphaerales bacterium]|nr:hypothetical protein [Phycisphaerales bacterium]
MPPLSRLTLPVYESLVAQLRFAPPEAVRRAIERGEELASQVDPEGEYPPEWVVYWITRYRPESAGDSPRVVKGAELLAQVSALVEHLCDLAGFDEADLAQDAVTHGLVFVSPDELAKRWNVSRKTIDRCRSKGLVGRRVQIGKGRVRVVINAAAAEGFRARHAHKLTRAAGYSRMDDAVIEKIVRRAGVYRARFGWSLNQTAKRLSERFGRSHETVRQILRKHDAAGMILLERPARRDLNPGPHGASNAATSGRATGPAAAPSHPRGKNTVKAPVPRNARGNKSRPARAFDDPSPMNKRERQVAWRAMRRSLEPSLIAGRLGHSKAAITRGILLERLDRLNSAMPDLDSHESPMFEREDAHQVFLQSSSVRGDLFRMPEPELGDFLHAHRARVVAVGAEESARSFAYHFLLWRSRRAIAMVSHLHPGAVEIDHIETDLRWATRLKGALVRGQLPLMIQTIEGRLGVGLHTLRPSETAAFLRVCIAAIGEVVHTFDPVRASSSGARLAGSVSPIITKLVAQWAKTAIEPAGRGRASAVYTLSTPVDDWTLNLSTWQRWLEPDRRIRSVALVMQDESGAFLRDRFGWGANAPQTLAAMAAARNLTAMRAATLERQSIRKAWGLIRGEA